jgi:O-antigen/teichoic acid export membrane protein
MHELFEHESGYHSNSNFRRYKLFPLEETLAAQPTTEVAISARPATLVETPPNGLAQMTAVERRAAFDDFATIPMVVLGDIARQQGSPMTAMRSDITQAAGSAAYVSVGNLGGTLLKYGSNLIIQRGFGPAAFGVYTLCLSIVGLVTAIANLGLDDAMLRFVPIYRAKRKPASLRALVIFCTALAGVSGILGALFMLLSAPWLATIRHSPLLVPALVLIAPLVTLSCLQTVWLGGLQGFKDFKWRVLLQRVLLPVVLIVLFLVVDLFFHTLSAVIIATVVYGFIGAILSFYFLFRRMPQVLRVEPGAYELRRWFGFAAPNFLTSIVDTTMESIDTLLLAFFAVSNVALGLYATAIKISSFIAMPLASFNAMFAPTIAELHSQGEHQKLAAMFQIVTKWSITFSLPIFWIVTLFSVPLLSISGPQFIAAWPLVVAFAVGSLINVATGPVGYILLMTGHTKTSFLNSLTAIIVNVAVGVILTPRYGAIGVAISTGMAVAVVNLMKLLQVRILVKMQPYRWDVLKPVGAGLISASLTAGLLYLTNQAHLYWQISHYHITLGLLLIPVFGACYIELLVLFRMSPEDTIVLNMLRKKIKRGKSKTR